jgi:hypothetical protein
MFTPDWGDRFWSKAHPEALSGCWLWHGALMNSGYGRFWLSSAVAAHRHAYALVHGPIARTAQVCHRCDVKACVNPDHLFLGTASDNQVDALKKQRRRSVKLNPDTVREVRAMCSMGVSQREVARRFCVSQTTVSRSVARITWCHVEGHDEQGGSK